MTFIEQQGVAKAIDGIAYALEQWARLIVIYHDMGERALLRHDVSYFNRCDDKAEKLWAMCDGHITLEDGSDYDTTWDLIFQVSGID